MRARRVRCRARCGRLAGAPVGAVVAGCSRPSGGRPGRRRARGATATASPTRPSGYGAVFLAVDECSSFGTTSFTEVPCTSERAAARVDGPVRRQGVGRPALPVDHGLRPAHQRDSGPPSDEDGDGSVPQGYACMRKLQPPHPGDPGGGGGPRTIVGDCVYGAGRGEVRETACDGRAGHNPEYKVTSAVDATARSARPSTALYVRLGGDRPVGCAVPV